MPAQTSYKLTPPAPTPSHHVSLEMNHPDVGVCEQTSPGQFLKEALLLLCACACEIHTIRLNFSPQAFLGEHNLGETLECT